MKNRDRLVGGADAPEEQKDILKLPEETEEKTRTAGPCCTCLAQVPGTTGYNSFLMIFYRKIDLYWRNILKKRTILIKN